MNDVAAANPVAQEQKRELAQLSLVVEPARYTHALADMLHQLPDVDALHGCTSSRLLAWRCGREALPRCPRTSPPCDGLVRTRLRGSAGGVDWESFPPEGFPSDGFSSVTFCVRAPPPAWTTDRFSTAAARSFFAFAAAFACDSEASPPLPWIRTPDGARFRSGRWTPTSFFSCGGA